MGQAVWEEFRNSLSGSWVSNFLHIIHLGPWEGMVILGLYWENGKEMETTIVYWGCIGMMEKKMKASEGNRHLSKHE